MQRSTREIVRAALDADSSVPAEARSQALRLLDGEDRQALGRVIRTAEAQKLLGVTSKTMRIWSLRGALVPVYAGQTRRRTGYTEASVRAILAGRKGGADHEE